jgi:hypothetical protein
VHQHRAALDVAQELETEALALRRPRDEPRDVGDGEGHATCLDDAEVGHQRREGVVGDLRAGRADRGDERGLARAREADQRDVGDALELEHDVEDLAGLAEQREAGGLPLGVGQLGVAEAAAPARRDDVPRALPDQVGELVAVGVEDDGAVGDGQLQRRAVGAVAVAALAGPAAGGLLVRVEVVVQQRGRVVLDDEDHVAAVTAVAAVGTAEGLELLAVDGRAAVPAVAGGDVQHDAVDEAGHGVLSGLRETRRAGQEVPARPS